jgi:hypothetical protein
MLKWTGYILIIVLIIAIITAPSEEKFTKFANSKAGSPACKPYVDYQSYKVIVTVFGIGHIRECKTTNAIYNPQTGQNVKSNVALPVYGEKQTYLGLFGTFWKL